MSTQGFNDVHTMLCWTIWRFLSGNGRVMLLVSGTGRVHDKGHRKQSHICTGVIRAAEDEAIYTNPSPTIHLCELHRP
jgi:hypothetical protein